MDGIDLHSLLLGAFLIFIAAVTLCIIREQRKDPLFRATDLVTSDNGRIAQNKFFAAGAFFCTTYAFVDGVATNVDHTGMIVAFSSVWAGAALLNKTINNTTTAPTPPTTVTTTTAGSGTVTTTVEGKTNEP